MRLFQALFARTTLAIVLLGLPTMAFAATSAPLEVHNNAAGPIVLTAQTPGSCGSWTGVAPFPPSTVASGATSATFFLVVPIACASFNHASLTYTLPSGAFPTTCTYTIDGNATFTYGASGSPGCAVGFPGTGQVIFIFPGSSMHVRALPHRTQ
jgi:hypothetical protein